MNVQNRELVNAAVEHGNAIGQVALAEFVLTNYGSELSPQLNRFLEKVKESSYNTIGERMEKPAEDVALEVAGIMALKFH